MFDVGRLLKTQPFDERFVLGGTEDVCRALNSYSSVALVSFEADSLFYGIGLKNHLERAGVNVFMLSLDEGVLPSALSEILRDCDAVVAVGERKICDLVRANAQKTVIYVPTSLVFYHAFCPVVFDTSSGLPEKKEAPLPDKVVFDTEIIKKLKNRHVADAFSITAAARLWKLEGEIASSYKTKIPSDAVSALDDALLRLSRLRGNVYAALLTCQIDLAYAVYLAPELDFGADRYACFALSSSADVPEEETRFYYAQTISAFYRAMLAENVSRNLIIPDYNSYALRLIDYLDIPPSVVYSSNNPMTAELSEKIISCAYKTDAYTRAQACCVDLAGFKKSYSQVYAGRKKRVDVQTKSAINALVLSAGLGDGLLSAFAYTGIVEKLNELLAEYD